MVIRIAASRTAPRFLGSSVFASAAAASAGSRVCSVESSLGSVGSVTASE